MKHQAFVHLSTGRIRHGLRQRQHGAALVEFWVVAPLLLLLTFTLLHYATYFFAKNQINHATFMAARAGAVNNASVVAIRRAYIDALVPLYGGGLDAAELATARAQAESDVAEMEVILQRSVVEILNPTKLSFDDWAEPGVRQISNTGLEYRDAGVYGATSHQSIQDANLLRVRVTHLFLPKVPLINFLYKFLSFDDARLNEALAQGRLPISSTVTLQMHSDPIEN